MVNVFALPPATYPENLEDLQKPENRQDLKKSAEATGLRACRGIIRPQVLLTSSSTTPSPTPPQPPGKVNRREKSHLGNRKTCILRWEADYYFLGVDRLVWKCIGLPKNKPTYFKPIHFQISQSTSGKVDWLTACPTFSLFLPAALVESSSSYKQIDTPKEWPLLM